MMNLAKLKGHVPDSVIAQIPFIQSNYKVNTLLRLSHFLAQCGHESANFRAVKENLNYSAEGLNKTFKKYFPTLESAKDYARQPERIASKVYANRMGNGNEVSKDGFKYLGRGFIQLTGKANYLEFDKSVPEDIIANPELVATKYPLASAAWFWNKNGLNEIADKGATDAIVKSITKRVNGGTIGLPDRIQHFNEFYSLLS
jgi:putative chitinase